MHSCGSRPRVLRALALAVSAALALPVLVGAQKPSGPQPMGRGSAAILRDITRTALPRGDRVTIEFSQEVTYTGDRVGNPDRVFFDLGRVSIPAVVAQRAQGLSGTLVKAVRVARHSEQTTRVVLELLKNPRYSVFAMYNPFRLVIDVEQGQTTAGITASAPPATSLSPVDDASPRTVGAPTSFTAAVVPAAAKPVAPLLTPVDVGPPPAAPAPPTITSHGDYTLGRQLGLGVSRIVIDAGHGGHDPGAQANGVVEAELVLDVAQRLDQLLREQPGFDVVLTRAKDEFIPLEERTAIANREGADLFLSIHANASRQTSARGVETYFLNFATNPAAEAVAARENATGNQTMGNLPALVKAITLNNKLAESRELATMVQTSMMRRLSLQNKSLKDLGVKQAPFVVLIGAQMPSVLAEISFVTNRGDASLLKQANYRQRIAQALFDAVVKYQASLKKVTTVAGKAQGR